MLARAASHQYSNLYCCNSTMTLTRHPTHDMLINDFARRAFRDTADMDYIAARLALQAELIPQFLWSSLQAFEKYFKYILLVNRISSKSVGHKIDSGLSEIRARVPYVTDMRPDAHAVFKQIAAYGPDRYLIGSWSVHGPLLSELDAAIWDVRRYCQVLSASPGSAPEDIRIYELTLQAIKNARRAPHKFSLAGGYLEQIAGKKHHPSYAALNRKNSYFGKRAKASGSERFYLQAANAPLFLHPSMIDELDRLIILPKDAKPAFQMQREQNQTGKELAQRSKKGDYDGQ